MWIIKHIFDGDYGCEESGGEGRVTVTLTNEKQEERVERVADSWLTERGLEVGAEWPEKNK